jgi:hypothetical protein
MHLKTEMESNKGIIDKSLMRVSSEARGGNAHQLVPAFRVAQDCSVIGDVIAHKEV